MSVDVTVVRVFTDPQGDFGNPLGVVDAARVDDADRQRLATELGYSETIFVALPVAGATSAHATIYTPRTQLPFAGHPTVGAAWWLRRNGSPVRTLHVPAGAVPVTYDGDLTRITARATWAPELWLRQLDSVQALTAVDPADLRQDTAHYLWAWLDRSAGSLRARMFAANLGVPEDEATGSAAMRLTDHLGRDLHITQGRGSMLETTWGPPGWVGVAGRVVDDGVRRME